MIDKDNWTEIINTINKNKLRTFLSGFTVALGIFIFIILFGFGNGLNNTFQKFFNDDGTNTIFIFPGTTQNPFKGYESGRKIEFDNSPLRSLLVIHPIFPPLSFESSSFEYSSARSEKFKFEVSFSLISKILALFSSLELFLLDRNI